MIEVTVIDDGATAEAETPEDALCAALTMGRECRIAKGLQGFDPRIRFTVAGEPVRVFTLRELTR